jgi:hypothetical protein
MDKCDICKRRIWPWQRRGVHSDLLDPVLGEAKYNSDDRHWQCHMLQVLSKLFNAEFGSPYMKSLWDATIPLFKTYRRDNRV